MKKRKLKILFCGYRKWARKIEAYLWLHRYNVKGVETPEDLLVEIKKTNYDVIVAVGWSWLIPADIVNSHVVVGMHPSDLPRYAGGSPIQNQVLDGITSTMATLFRMNEKFDDGMIIDKEPICLDGHLDDIMNSIANATTNMLLRFLEKFPDFVEVEQSTYGAGFSRKRLKPNQSQLTKEAISGKTCAQLWNFIRCREDPYPNVFMEDDTGVLTITRAEFKPK